MKKIKHVSSNFLSIFLKCVIIYDDGKMLKHLTNEFQFIDFIVKRVAIAWSYIIVCFHATVRI
ncbi:MAG: hypothetical protein AAF757_18650, partial [Cyanobacteria bacterium P01_D01_bin.116]